jgi:hypothetical protein
VRQRGVSGDETLARIIDSLEWYGKVPPAKPASMFSFSHGQNYFGSPQELVKTSQIIDDFEDGVF